VLGEAGAELHRLTHDQGVLLVLVGAMFLYAALYPVPYAHEVLDQVPVAIVDLDGSDLSRDLARMADAHQLLAVAARPGSVEQGATLVRERQVGGFMVVPPGFERRIRRGERAVVAGYVDAGYFLVYRQVLTGFSETAGTLSAGIEIRRLHGEGLAPRQAVRVRDPLPLATRPLFNATEGYATYVVPGVLVLILQQTLLVGVGMVGGTRRERRELSPMGPSPMGPSGTVAKVIGRALVYLALYFVHSLFYFGVVYAVYGFPMRARAADLAWFVLPFLLAAIFLAFTLRPLFRTRESSIHFLLWSSLPAIFLAGFAWPVEALPTWLAAAGRALPSTSAIPGVIRMTGMGATLAQAGAEWWTLWALAGIYFATALVATRVSDC
jgi:ABC-2 type transport system permease protein